MTGRPISPMVLVLWGGYLLLGVGVWLLWTRAAGLQIPLLLVKPALGAALAYGGLLGLLQAWQRAGKMRERLRAGLEGGPILGNGPLLLLLSAIFTLVLYGFNRPFTGGLLPRLSLFGMVSLALLSYLATLGLFLILFRLFVRLTTRPAPQEAQPPTVQVE